ncbi:SagB/ThcOx family dehydrogenase [Lactobacillus amylovorus]|uniref:SagB/ThcOx family dehydrogenase n=2 Tax=Lactobacillus TaxID=1578 RepID=A0AAW6BAZ9_LACAM|nr:MULTISPECIES: SagB/ThcOx family dehydrogenase [Lactobacillus]MDA6090031.1 SagB/ThcOx family dehydrogenase [Lactobacillus amylovorus]MDB6222928.1 SagB/ThcOx family dehydrogenase [Lactobacillus amylovorus]MDB6247356.1 SagB/ThcOx family dehydrogenase [Lactobacillus amylovorus]TDM95016.1 hypothetical protein CEE88_13425 [Lactobacillus crispatus]UIK35283.1 SagB/ThcOx family dehydrogenase [Lactobacillus amylovorus]
MKIDDESCLMINNKLPLYKYFNENTSLNNQNSSIFNTSIAAAFDDEKYRLHTINTVKHSTRKKESYPIDIEYDDNELEKAILNRKSTRNFSNKLVKNKDFCKILGLSFGFNKCDGFTVPSAGGIYEIKLIVIINRVEGIKSGIYLYDINSSSLLPLISNFNTWDYQKITYSLTLAENCAFSVHAITNPIFMTYKYGDRGYRFLNLECGHIFQNLSLIANHLNVGSVCSGGFAEKSFIEYLNHESCLDFHDYMVLYEEFFGKES